MINRLIEDAERYINRQNFKAAIKKYKEILNIKPDLDEAHFRIGSLYRHLNQHENALAYFETAFRINPKHINNLAGFSTSLFSLNRFGEALAAINTALQHDSCNPILIRQRAAILAHSHLFDDAFDTYLTAFQRLPEHKNMWLDEMANLANYVCYRSLFIEADDLQRNKALHLIDKALSIFTFLIKQKEIKYSAMGCYHAGLIERYLGKKDIALSHFSHASSLIPDWHAPKLCYAALSKQQLYKNNSKRTGQKQKLILHAGYPKAGSTWLQAAFFPNLTRIKHFGESQFEYRTTEDLIRDHYGFPLASSQFYNYICQDEYDEMTAMEMLKNIIGDLPFSSFSYEGLTVPHQFKFDRLKRLKELLDLDMKLLIIIRRQKDIVFSTYGQYLKSGVYRNETLSQVVDWHNTDDSTQVINLEHYNYLNLYKTAVYLFGKENVLLLPFEHLFSRKMEAMLEMCSFFGVDQEVDIIRLMAGKPPLNTSRQTKFTADSCQDKDRVLSNVHDFFIDSNRELDRQLNYDLGRMGYF